MGKTLVKAAHLATLDDSLGVIPRGAIVVEGGRIAAAGPWEEISRLGPFAEEAGSLEDDILMPGLTSAHHHAGRNFRDGISDQPLECWIQTLYGNAQSAGFNDEEVYLNTVWSCLELIRGGCTSVVDHHAPSPARERLGVPAAVRAYRDAGMRVGLCVGVRNQNRFHYEGDEAVFGRLPPEVQEEVGGFLKPLDQGRFFETWDSYFEDLHEPEGRVRIFLGPSGPQWCSEDLLARVKDAAGRRSTGIQIHLLETVYQRALGPRWKGKSLVRWLDELGFWGEEVSCAHGVWLSREDMDILRDRGVTLVHNPSSNLRLSSGIAPVRLMREAGMSVAIGADGMGMNDDNDMLTDLRLGHLLQRLPGVDTPPIAPGEWWKLAVAGGARALLQPGDLGSLAPGKKADFILVSAKRLRAPAANPDLDPLELLLQRGVGRDVHAVYVEGRALMREGKILSVDEEALAAEIGRIWALRYPRVKALRPLYKKLEEEIRKEFGGWDLRLPHANCYRYNAP
ncbi:MAG: amidohydrolase family protein [bacterium]